MKRNRKCLLAFATLVAPLPALALFAPPAAAQAPAWDASGNVALTSDYVFRGVSQTDEDPAVQAGLKLQHVPSGFYGALWSSNVDYGDEIGSNAELDLVLGWGHSFSDDVALDLNLTRYTYPGTNDEFELDYNELIGTLTFRQKYWLQVGWSNDVFASDAAGTYVQVAGKWPFADAWRVEALAAHYFLDYDAYDSDYSHAQLSLVYAWKQLEFRLSGHFTDGNAKDLFGDRLAGTRAEAAVNFAF